MTPSAHHRPERVQAGGRLRVEHRLQADGEQHRYRPAPVDEPVQEPRGRQQRRAAPSAHRAASPARTGHEGAEREQDRGEDPRPPAAHAPAGPHRRRDRHQSRSAATARGWRSRRAEHVDPELQHHVVQRRGTRPAHDARQVPNECWRDPDRAASLNHSSPLIVRVRMTAETTINISRIPPVQPTGQAVEPSRGADLDGSAGTPSSGPAGGGWGALAWSATSGAPRRHRRSHYGHLLERTALSATQQAPR